ISFDSGISVALGGNLVLDLAAGVNPASLLGQSLQLFDWTGVNPSGQFTNIMNNLPTGYSWNTSQLYATGDVTLAPSTIWASAVSGNWSDSTRWTGGVPSGDGAVAAINAPTSAALTV